MTPRKFFKEHRSPRLFRRPALVGAISLLMMMIVMILATHGRGPEMKAAGSSADRPGAEAQDFSRFRHDTQQHRRLPCLVCHVRSDNSSTPRMPGHIPCSSCHSQQFAEGNSNPICSICHTATSVKRFPPLRSFNAVFDHGRHRRLTNCATCHRPGRAGVALSIPSRLSAHATCFQCHGPQTIAGDRNIGSCSTCHQPGRLVRTPETARAFAVGFSHAEHSRKGLSCTACHTVRAGGRRGAQVSSPLAAMHFARPGVASCSACHNDRRAFGGDDFSDCKLCHNGNRFGF